MKKKTKLPKQTSWRFDIGQLDYDTENNLQPFRPVLLDKKTIYKIDKTKIYADLERDQTQEIIDALKKETGYEFTKSQIQRAMTLGVLEKP